MKRLLIDVSFIYETDLNTGIQRVVRQVSENIEYIEQAFNIEVLFVLLHKDNNIYTYTFTSKEIKQFVPKEGDLLLMLDSTWHLNIWKNFNKLHPSTKKIAVIYDLIPIYFPQFCDDNLVKIFKRWFFDAVKQIDGFIGISNSVIENVKEYLNKNFSDDNFSQKSFDYFWLGGDFSYDKIKVFEKSEIRKELVELYNNKQNIYLTVSTIEPRKNHKYLLDAFEKLWQQNVNVTLNIVGKIGWKVDDLIKRITTHPQYNKKLFMWNDLTDKELEYCYQNSKMLLFASFVEGFGLPIVESLSKGLPVMASDTPIHNEIGQDKIGYFNIDDINDLVAKIKEIEKDGTPKKLFPKDYRWLSWRESTEMLFEKIIKMEKEFLKREIKNKTIQEIADMIVQRNLYHFFDDKDYFTLAQAIKKTN